MNDTNSDKRIAADILIALINATKEANLYHPEKFAGTFTNAFDKILKGIQNPNQDTPNYQE